MSKFQSILSKILIHIYLYLGFKEVNIIKIDGKYYLHRIKNPEYIGDFEVSIAVIRRIKIFNFHIPVIITDDWFDVITRNDDNLKEFIIRHEIGHYELKHFELNLNNLSIDEKIELEIEADSYAANHVGNDIALNSIEYIELFLNKIFKIYDESLEERKKSLKIKIEAA